MKPNLNMDKKTMWQIALTVTFIFFMVFAFSSYKNLKKMRFEFNEKKSVLTRENLELKDRLDSIQEMVSQKMISLGILEQEKRKVEEQVAALKQENDKLMQASNEELKGIRQKNAALKKKIGELENSSVVRSIKDALEHESNENIRVVVEDTLNKIELIKTGNPVALEPIVVTNEAGGIAGGAGDYANVSTVGGNGNGTILSVDRKNSLIVINLGAKERVKEGDRLKILKGGKAIAQAEIISVRYRLSAAVVDTILPAYSMNNIEENENILVITK